MQFAQNSRNSKRTSTLKQDIFLQEQIIYLSPKIKS